MLNFEIMINISLTVGENDAGDGALRQSSILHASSTTSLVYLPLSGSLVPFYPAHGSCLLHTRNCNQRRAGNNFRYQGEAFGQWAVGP